MEKEGFTSRSAHRLSDAFQQALGFSVRAQKSPVTLASEGTCRKIATQCTRHSPGCRTKVREIWWI